jgi:type I restriction enzyme M protein
MIAIRSNFFYTRTVPCELWFLNRAKPKEHRDKVLMVDARNIYRKVTRKIYDFSPEQEKNILAIIWLYRGQNERFLGLVADYCTRTLEEADACFTLMGAEGGESHPLEDFSTSLSTLLDNINPFLKTLAQDAPHGEVLKELEQGRKLFTSDIHAFQVALNHEKSEWKRRKKTNGALKEAVERLAHLAGVSRDLVKQTDLLYKLACRLIDVCEKECNARDNELWAGREITRARKAVDEARQKAVEKLKQVRYFWKQAHWLTERFPEAKLRDVEGLVKLVEWAEIAANDWSLTPGRYVGVAPEEEDDNFDFEEAIREIHLELEGLNAEAQELAARIKRNFEELGV